MVTAVKPRPKIKTKSGPKNISRAEIRKRNKRNLIILATLLLTIGITAYHLYQTHHAILAEWEQSRADHEGDTMPTDGIWIRVHEPGLYWDIINVEVPPGHTIDTSLAKIRSMGMEIIEILPPSTSSQNLYEVHASEAREAPLWK